MANHTAHRMEAKTLEQKREERAENERNGTALPGQPSPGQPVLVVKVGEDSKIVVEGLVPSHLFAVKMLLEAVMYLETVRETQIMAAQQQAENAATSSIARVN